MTSTQIVAWWGAVLATIVLVWDVVKWRRNAPRLRLTARPESYYQDSEKIPVKGDGKGSAEFLLKPSIHVELINIGSLPTTIMGINARRTMEGGSWSGYDGSRFRAHFGKKLPYLIGPGDIWSCRVDQETIMSLPGKGPIQICVTASHLMKPLVAEVFPKEIEANQSVAR